MSDFLAALIVFGVFLTLCFLIAYFLGRKRQIGFGWSLFFSFFFSPILGFIGTLLSPKYQYEEVKPSPGKKTAGGIFIVLGLLFIVSGLAMPLDVENPSAKVQGISLGIGVLGLGIFFIMRSDGKSFHSKSLTPFD